MFGIDKVKLILDLEDVEIIHDEVFTQKVVEDELVESSFNMEEPFSLMIKKNYRRRESVIEFTGKILESDYHRLIRLDNIHRCFDNIHKLGICKISHYLSADVVLCDVTNDYHVFSIKDLTDFIAGNLSSYRKYKTTPYRNGNFTIETTANSKQYKRRLTIYDKGKEMYMAKNKEFLSAYYDDVNPFVKKGRFELNLKSKHQIRSSLHIKDTKLLTVLLSAQSVNPIFDFLSEVIREEDVTFQKSNNGNQIYQYLRYCALVVNDFDMEKLDAVIRPLCSKGTKVNSVLKPFRQMIDEMKADTGTYNRDKLLDLVRTEPQVTPALIKQFL